MKHEQSFVITNWLTKVCCAGPLKSCTAAVVVTAFLEDFFYLKGIPLSLLTGEWIQFISKSFKAVCSILGIKHVTATAYHLQTNR